MNRPSATPFIPLYYQLASLLEQKLDSNEYPPGSRLPTEAQLSAEYGVSVITARNAMKILTDKGRVERFPGKGSFVVERGPVRAAWAFGSIVDIVMTTANSEMTTLATGLVEAPGWVGKAFRLARGDTLHWMRSVRSVEGERFMVSDVYHHPDLTPLVHSARFRKLVRQKKLVVQAVAEVAGVALGEIKQSLSATLATPEIADTLMMDAGQPLLVVERLFMGADGRILQVGKTHYRVDHYRYGLNLRPIDEAAPEPGRRRKLGEAG